MTSRMPSFNEVREGRERVGKKEREHEGDLGLPKRERRC